VFIPFIPCWLLVMNMNSRWPAAVIWCFSCSALTNDSSDSGYPLWLCSSENTAILLKHLSITISSWCIQLYEEESASAEVWQCISTRASWSSSINILSKVYEDAMKPSKCRGILSNLSCSPLITDKRSVLL